MPIWIGADPGGASAFGLAMLEDGCIVGTWVVDSAAEAIQVVRGRLEGSPDGVGVDSPLWWSAAAGGGRKADEWLRSTYKIPSGTVQSSNSLRGAALVQGALFVHRLREFWPQVLVTESHPKALLMAMGKPALRTVLEEYGVCSAVAVSSEHERDALLGAIAAREGFEGRWPRDLSRDRCPEEQDPDTYWLAPVRYWWPDLPAVRSHPSSDGSDR